jgi:hypothetical protein
LKKEDGGWVEDEVEKQGFITNYFKQLFRSNGLNNAQQLLDVVAPCVTREMNETLLADFREEEVIAALNSTGDMKAPGLDGMPSIFYKKFWDIVGSKVTMEVLQILNEGRPIPAEWNQTTIALIPKVKWPESVTELRPISLCNVLYKIVSKILANGLKGILPEIVSPTQSAFVPGRLI